jgi:hypothetical protein
MKPFLANRRNIELRKGYWKLQMAQCDPVITALQHSDLRSLYLTTTLKEADASTPKCLGLLVQQAIVKLLSLITLTLDVPIDAATWEKEGQTWTVRLTNPIREIDHATGAMHKFIKSKGRYSIGVRWDTGTNGTLTWTDEEYWRSIKWGNLGLIQQVGGLPVGGITQDNLRRL